MWDNNSNTNEYNHKDKGVNQHIIKAENMQIH